VVGIDPGKRNLLYVTNQHAPDDGEPKKEGVRLRYTFAQRRLDSGACARQQKLNIEKSQRILELERELSSHNSRTTSRAKFEAYLRKRLQVQQELKAHYHKPQHRVARWHNWRDRRKSEDKFVQKVLKTFAPPPPSPVVVTPGAAATSTTSTAAQPPRLIVAYGNGSGFHALRGSPPSPTTGLRKRFRAKAHQGLVVIDTPEYGTSKMCSYCKGELMEDPHRKRKRERKDGKKDLVSVWGIRRCNSANCGGLRRWNRDHNAAINIRANLLHYLESGTWPLQQQQQTGIDDDDTTNTIISADGPPGASNSPG